MIHETRMIPLSLLAIALLALILWRGLFTAFRLQKALGGSAAQQRRKRRILQGGFQILDNHLLADLLERQERAKGYLRRVVALCGARQAPDG